MSGKDIIGENGEGLSGGQIQAVGIARVFLFNYPVMLFDEPTSSMDRQTEMKVLNNLSLSLKSKMMVLVTQKMSLLDLVEKVIVINNKTVYINGKKEDVIKLLSEGGSYE